jgi:hypothetical protein
MPTDAEQIGTIKTQTLAAIVDVTANPKPTYMIDGQMVSWTAYLKQLQETIVWCDKQLAGETPFEVRSQGYT